MALITAEWRHLAMLNYAAEPAILAPFIPNGTELDSWNGTTYVSIVGFLFANVRISRLIIPFHRNFEEVNLRFYVRRKSAEGWRRGVVFIKEIVPRSLVAIVAQTLYNEPYIALPMSHHIENSAGLPRIVRYNWRFDGLQNSLTVAVRGGPQLLVRDSEAEFITEHYWGYNAQRDGSTLEYRVDHPPWRVFEVADASLQGDVAGVYGPAFQTCLGQTPLSAFLAEGSEIAVQPGLRLRPQEVKS
jgi:hypothetical protein